MICDVFSLPFPHFACQNGREWPCNEQSFGRLIDLPVVEFFRL